MGIRKVPVANGQGEIWTEVQGLGGLQHDAGPVGREGKPDLPKAKRKSRRSKIRTKSSAKLRQRGQDDAGQPTQPGVVQDANGIPTPEEILRSFTPDQNRVVAQFLDFKLKEQELLLNEQFMKILADRERPEEPLTLDDAELTKPAEPAYFPPPTPPVAEQQFFKSPVYTPPAEPTYTEYQVQMIADRAAQAAVEKFAVSFIPANIAPVTQYVAPAPTVRTPVAYVPTPGLTSWRR